MYTLLEQSIEDRTVSPERVAKRNLSPIRLEQAFTGDSELFIDTDVSSMEAITRFDIRD